MLYLTKSTEMLGTFERVPPVVRINLSMLVLLEVDKSAGTCR